MTEGTTDKLLEELQQPIDATRLMETAGKYLYGDLRDWLIGQIKHLPKPWAQMNEYEQQTVINGAGEVARETVLRAVETVAAGGRTIVSAQLEAVTVKDGIKAVLAIGRHEEMRHELIDAQGARVLVLVTDARPYGSAEKPAKPDPDQGSLIDPDTGEIREPGAGAEAAPPEGQEAPPPASAEPQPTIAACACGRPASDEEGIAICPGFKGEPCKMREPVPEAQKPATWVPDQPTGGIAATGDGGKDRGGAAPAKVRKPRQRKAA